MLGTSPDGSAWTRITDPSMFAGATIQAVTDGPHGLMAVGDTGWDHPAIWVSDSRATWQRLALPSAAFAAANVSDVRATATGYVLAGGTGTQQVSVTGGPEAYASGVAAGWWSLNGRTWTKATVQRPGGSGSNLGLLYVGAHGLVAVGSTSRGDLTAWTSSDDRTWQPIAAGYFGGPPSRPASRRCPPSPSPTTARISSRWAWGISWHCACGPRRMA